MRRWIRVRIGLDRVQLSLRIETVNSRVAKSQAALNCQWIGPCRHEEDEMKGITHGRICRNRYPAIAPFRFRSATLPSLNPCPSWSSICWPSRNICEVVRCPSYPSALTSFTTTCGARRTACSLPHIGRASLRRAEPSAGTHRLAEPRECACAAWEGLLRH